MTDKLYPIREYKAAVFATLFDSRPELLSLYNAVNGSHYDDPEKLTINTLEHAIYMGYQNELPVEEAVDRAVAECIKEGILEKFLRDQKAQVVAMSIFEWNQEEEMRKLREAEFELGMERGQALGELSGKAAFIVELLEETGPAPEWLRTRISREKDRKILSQWHRTAAKAGSMEEFVRLTGLEQENSDKHEN